MAYWLMKSEPSVFSVDDLARRPGKRDHWDGVRNYQARNMIRDQMKKGDLAFFYHSGDEKGIAGIMKIVSDAYPDSTAFDPKDHHHDPRSDPSAPTWYMVDVQLVRKLKRLVTLAELKAHPGLKDMVVVRPGTRLSVMPVTEKEWEIVLSME